MVPSRNEPSRHVESAKTEAEIFASVYLLHSPALAPHLSTVDTAHDLDVLRAALGEKKLTYLGFSYGTYLGTVYADLFPHRVGRFVLDGAHHYHDRGDGAGSIQ